MIGIDVKRVPINIHDIDYINIKCPMFSFARLDGIDPILKVEMSSTGEVACIGNNKYDTYLNAIISSGIKIPKIKSALISIGPTELKVEFLESVKLLKDIGYKIYSTKGTHDLLIKEEIESTLLNKAEGNQSNNVIDYIKLKKIGIVINIPENKNKSYRSKTDGFLLRRCAVDNNIALMTNIKNAKFLVSSLYNHFKFKDDIVEIKSWQEYLDEYN